MSVVFDDGYRTVGGTVSISGPVTDIGFQCTFMIVPRRKTKGFTLYKSLFGASALYFMAEYRVERNRCFLAIPDLIDNGFIIQVAAENREGNIIAKSRGILDQGNPRDW